MRPYFIHDAAPFPNGPLHMGHVRTYVLGDVQARYRRMRGETVLYHTGFDAFGLPIELAARERGVPPQVLVRESIATMTEQLKRLGISYDWSMVRTTCDPACYRWTQWLFLELYRAGLVVRREATVAWCDGCATSLSPMQIDGGNCWRCRGDVRERALAQWYVLTSRYREAMAADLDALVGWSPRVRGAIAAIAAEPGDWHVSRQRSWGTPIPLVHCERCGVVPLADDALPLRLPDDLDWSLPRPLAAHERFADSHCPACNGAARRELDTLDCFFDDIWCFLQGVVLDRGGFDRETLTRYLPVDLAQSGLDTVAYFHLYRFLGRFLVERGLLDDPEPIRRFPGSGMVLADGRKMSKHLGNAVSPQSLLDRHGSDALRLAILWAADPARDIDWQPELVDRAVHLLNRVTELRGWRGALDESHEGAETRAMKALLVRGDRRLAAIAAFVEGYRPHAAISEIDRWARGIRRFAARRLASSRLSGADARCLAREIDRLTTALAPFAPDQAGDVSLWPLAHSVGRAARR